MIVFTITLQISALNNLLQPLPRNKEENIIIYTTDSEETFSYSCECEPYLPPDKDLKHSVSKTIQAVLEKKIVTFLKHILDFIHLFVPNVANNCRYPNVFDMIKTKLFSTEKISPLLEEFSYVVKGISLYMKFTFFEHFTFVE